MQSQYEIDRGKEGTFNLRCCVDGLRTILATLLATCAIPLMAEPVTVQIVGPNVSSYGQAAVAIAQELDNILSADLDYAGSSAFGTQLSGQALSESYYHPSYREATRAALAAGTNYVVILPEHEFLYSYPEMTFEGVLQMSQAALNAGSQPLLMMPSYAGNEGVVNKNGENIYRIANGCGITPLPGGYASWSAGLTVTNSDYKRHRQAYLLAAMLYTQLTGRNAADTGYISDYNGTAVDVANLSGIATSTLNTHASTVHYTTSTENVGAVRYRHLETLPGNAIRFAYTGSSTERGIRKVLEPLAHAQGYATRRHHLMNHQGFSYYQYFESKPEFDAHPDQFLGLYARSTSTNAQTIINNSQANLLAFVLDRHGDGRSSWTKVLEDVYSTTNYLKTSYNYYGWLSTPIHLGAARLHDVDPTIAYSVDGVHMTTPLNYMVAASMIQSMIGRDLDPEMLPTNIGPHERTAFDVGRRMHKQLAFLSESEGFVPDTQLAIESGTGPVINRRLAVDYQFVASNGTGPFTWSVESDGLPEGLVLSSDGRLSGVTTVAAGPVSIVIKVEDDSGAIRKAAVVLTVAEPELQVLGNGQEIPFDNLTPTAMDGTDFGIVDSTLTRTFVITNNSDNRTFTLPTSPRVSITDGHGHFTLVQDALSGTLTPGASTTFKVRCNPQSSGVHTATISIASTYPEIPVYSFTVAGVGAAAPTVVHAGATAQAAPTAILSGELTAGGAAEVWFCWGDNDAGTTTPSAWDHEVSIGTVREGGVFNATVNNILFGKPYFARIYVSNNYGNSWSSVTVLSTTAPEVNYGTPGLISGNIPGNINKTTPNPGNGDGFATINLGPSRAQVGGGLQNRTYIYTGQMYFDGSDHFFIESILNKVWLKIDGTVYIDDSSWNNVGNSGVISKPAGWYDFELRMSGSGPHKINPGFQYHNGGGVSDLEADNWYPEDPGDASLFRTEYVDVVEPLSVSTATATNRTAVSADLHGLLNIQHASFTVTAYWSTTNNTDPAAWLADASAQSSTIGTLADLKHHDIIAPASSLTPNTNYYYTFVASNASTTIWADQNGHFNTLEGEVPQNAAPVAQGQSVQTDEESSALITLVATDADGDVLNYDIVGQPANGTLSGTAPNLTYMPSAGFSGLDAFTFHVNDGLVDSNLATVTIAVNETHVLTYHAGIGGSISGASLQVVADGADGSAVTALADTGYQFVGWSDATTTTNLTQQQGVVASQSSTGWGGAPERAIDGNINGNYSSGSVTHTAGQDSGWWQVALAGEALVSEIIIYNRTDCCAERLNDFRVSVFAANTEIYGVDISGLSGDFLSLVLPQGTFGDRVRIAFTDDSSQVLSLAEVEVHSPVAQATRTDQNITDDLAVTALFEAEVADLRAPENPSSTVAGLDWERFLGAWSALPDFDSLAAVDSGTTDRIGLDLGEPANNFGYRFIGYLDVPVDGEYLFYTHSDDGSKLYIGDVLVVDNDGLHPMRERSGTIGLKSGKHAISVTFFERTGGANLITSWAGPGFAKQTIAPSALSRDSADYAPGLWYGEVTGNPNLTTPNPKTALLVNPDTHTENNIAGNTTEIFTGQIYDADGAISFTENVDDKTRIYIDGILVLADDTWQTRTSTGNLNLTPGWHDLEIRISNGNGGSGPVSSPGIGYDPAGGSNWQTLVDPGDGSFLRASLIGSTEEGDLRTSENPTNTVAGLDWERYLGTWSVLPNFDALTPAATGWSSQFNLGHGEPSDNFGYRFTGYVEVPADGIYTFFTISDDGSALYIGDQLIVDNDGLHPMQERSGTIGLQAGKHAVTVIYFERSGGTGLTVSWSGPAMYKQIVPASAISTNASTTAAAADELTVVSPIKGGGELLTSGTMVGATTRTDASGIESEPTLTLELSNASVPEAQYGAFIGTVSANDDLIYSVDSIDFEIHPQTGELFLALDWAADYDQSTQLLVTVRGTNAMGTDTEQDFIIDVEKTLARVRLHLDEGWNLLSLPFALAPEQTLQGLLLDESGTALTRGKIWGWRGNGSRRYTALNAAVKAGTGFWVYSPAGGTTQVLKGHAPTDTTVTLHRGWNLFGPFRETAVDEIPNHRRGVWTYDAHTRTNQSVDWLKPGIGYWSYQP